MHERATWALQSYNHQAGFPSRMRPCEEACMAWIQWLIVGPPCLQLLLVLLLPMLFTLLGDTAELYFSPTMAIVAQSIPKMRPRFAGGR